MEWVKERSKSAWIETKVVNTANILFNVSLLSLGT